MKKTITIAALALFVFACSRKSVPTAGEGTATTKTEAPKEVAPKADAASAETLALGKTVYTTRCGRCHGLKNTEAYTHKEWEGILASMIPKAKLNEAEGKQVTAYVMANAKK